LGSPLLPSGSRHAQRRQHTSWSVVASRTGPSFSLSDRGLVRWRPDRKPDLRRRARTPAERPHRLHPRRPARAM